MPLEEPIDILRERQGREPDVVCRERLERLVKAIQVREPDRVPIILTGCPPGFALRYAGVTGYQYYYDYVDGWRAIVKFARDFPVDSIFFEVGVEGHVLAIAFPEVSEFMAATAGHLTGPMHDILRDRFSKFPGRELPEALTTVQFIGGRFMETEEYDKLIDNPLEFIRETILPRAFESLRNPSSHEARVALMKTGLELYKAMICMNTLAIELTKLGYPMAPLTNAYCPLDFIGDFLRHVNNVLLDVYKRPDKVKVACEALVKPILDMALSIKNAVHCFIPLHLNEMLPSRIYKELYWPYLKEVIFRLRESGLTIWVFFEGDHTPHLETLLELPKGWGIAWFEKADIKKAKKILDGHTCIMGGLPINLLVAGTPEKIEDYVKKLISELALGGGFILSTGVADIPPGTPVANLRALINAVLKYG
ncbi:MAG: uroporphyrinogen decarboxylase family protein [Candidatus Bathyarchaeia archaeon]